MASNHGGGELVGFFQAGSSLQVVDLTGCGGYLRHRLFGRSMLRVAGGAPAPHVADEIDHEAREDQGDHGSRVVGAYQNTLEGCLTCWNRKLTFGIIVRATAKFVVYGRDMPAKNGDRVRLIGPWVGDLK